MIFECSANKQLVPQDNLVGSLGTDIDLYFLKEGEALKFCENERVVAVVRIVKRTIFK